MRRAFGMRAWRLPFWRDHARNASELPHGCLLHVFVPSSVPGYCAAMERNHEHRGADPLGDPRGDAVIEALLAPERGSFVDALLALADEVTPGETPGDALRALNGGLQAALARRMRSAISQDNDRRDAA